MGNDDVEGGEEKVPVKYKPDSTRKIAYKHVEEMLNK